MAAVSISTWIFVSICNTFDFMYFFIYIYSLIAWLRPSRSRTAEHKSHRPSPYVVGGFSPLVISGSGVFTAGIPSQKLFFSGQHGDDWNFILKSRPIHRDKDRPSIIFRHRILFVSSMPLGPMVYVLIPIIVHVSNFFPEEIVKFLP